MGDAEFSELAAGTKYTTAVADMPQLAFDFLPFETDGDFRFLDLGDGIRSRVGVRHVPLSELLNKLIASGLSLEHEEEPGEGAVQWLLAPVASKRVQKR